MTTLLDIENSANPGPIAQDNFELIDAALFANGLTLVSYTVATVPSATTYAGKLILVTDGDGGIPCLAVASGGEWKRIPLFAAISAT